MAIKTAKKTEAKRKVVKRIKTRDEAMYESVLWIDWEKVRKVMRFLKWTWQIGKVERTPTTEELKEKALELMGELFVSYDNEKMLNSNLEERELRISSGGIFVSMGVLNGEIVTVSCGVTLDEYSTDMAYPTWQ